LLGSEPAAPFSVAALPPAPAAPLVVQADPWSPVRASLGAAIAPPAGLPAPVVTLTPPTLQRTKTPSIHHLKSIVRITPIARQAKIAAGPTPAAAPVAAAPVAAAPTVATPAAAATPTVAAAPVAAPTVPNRGLATATTPAPVTAAPTTTTAATPPKHQRDHPGRDRDKNQHGGDSSSGDSSPVILSATPVAAPQPVATPQPVVIAPLPSVDPPAPSSTWSHATTNTVTSGPHGHDAGVDSDGAGS
jgi:hypothetical protein